MGQIHEGWDGVFYCGFYFNVQISQTSREQHTLYAYDAQNQSLLLANSIKSLLCLNLDRTILKTEKESNLL